MAMNERELGEREFGNLIGSDKVEGTAVYGPNESKIGSIERVMIDKISGRVSYAVLGFGGFLGLGNDHYPLPCRLDDLGDAGLPGDRYAALARNHLLVIRARAVT
jgi:hypothetical protein